MNKLKFGDRIKVKLYARTHTHEAIFVGVGPSVRGMASVMALVEGGHGPVAFPFYR